MAFKRIFQIFAIVVIGPALLANIAFSVSEGDFEGVFSLRNIFLIAFLLCYIFYKRWSLLLLIILNIVYWYFLFIKYSNIVYTSNNSHAILNFTQAVVKICWENGVKPFGTIAKFSPFFLNALILIYDVPSRILKEVQRKPSDC